MKLIDKDALVAEIEKRLHKYEKEYKELAHYEIWFTAKEIEPKIKELKSLLSLLDTFEVKDPYEQCIQYPSVKDGINAHAETYSFNIESLLFNQLTKEQQELWRKEIEQAVISGGHCGVELARDKRYKENQEPVSEDLEKAAQEYVTKEGYLAGLFYYSMVRSFKAGAKWQKQQDQSTIELAEDHAMLVGMEKAENLKKLADAMYNAAQNMTTDASRLRKAMDEYHQYVVQEYYDKGIRL